MRRSVPVIAILLALFVSCLASPAGAIGEMTGVTMTMTPHEATAGMNMDMAVTVSNANDRDLIITSLTVQIYDGSFMTSSNEYKMYHINPDDGRVLANGSRSFEVPGNAPNYMGMCSIFVTIAGSFEGDGEGVENASFGTFTSSIDLTPNIGGFMLMGALMLIIPIVVIVVVVVAAVWYLGKSKGASPQYPARCPYCGDIIPPGSSCCPRCRKL